LPPYRTVAGPGVASEPRVPQKRTFTLMPPSSAAWAERACLSYL
jgi:hypothetical protein